ncbi:ferredoxin reductase [Actinomadura madurae]|uniref:ferredoxin reductase n=1 Tax=Actinomadura madurae TaxID=1993 RepID=UPI0020D23904|nr:ferredoxin reductase [Actinomadura madurae]MCQ0003682.1 ferredoxin reductase [Actinomadura madurae]
MLENEHELLVRSMTWEAAGVLSVTLAGLGGGPLPPWEPGAHLELDLGKWVRQYSLCGEPGESGAYRIAVLYEPDGRGGSAFVHEELRPGQTVRVRGPRNRFPMEDAPRYLFLAGGIGITPLLPMIARAAGPGRPVAAGLRRPEPELHGVPARTRPVRGRGDGRPRGPRRASGPRCPARHAAGGHRRLLLRSGGPARGGRGAVRGVAGRQPARRALRRGAARARRWTATAPRSRWSARGPG